MAAEDVDLILRVFRLAVPPRFVFFPLRGKPQRTVCLPHQSLLMSRTALAFLILGLFSYLFPPPVSAFPDRDQKGGLFGLSAGAVGIKDSVQLSFISFEYTFNKRFWALAPHIGLLVTTQTAIYGYAGLGLEFCPASRWMIIPRLSAGYYYPFCDQSLGNSLEFFSSLEIAYRFKDRSRLGLILGHMSNARLGSENPGTEFLFLSYTIPLDYLLGPFRK
jgi:lipid A 3-O-deacylase